MSVVLEYETLQPVSADVANLIEHDQQRLLDSHSYWVEPLWVELDASPPSKLIGCHKMFMSGGYSTNSGQWMDISQEEDWLMAWADARFIVQQLARWSLNHGIDWVILSYGEPVGRIVAGKPDDKLDSFVESMREMTRLDPAMVSEIDKKFESRAEPPPAPEPEPERPPSAYPFPKIKVSQSPPKKAPWWWPW